MSILSASTQWPDLVPARSDFEGTGTDRRVRPTVLRSLVTAVAQAPELWAPHVRFDLAERYFTRLHRDRDFEVWLICWETGQDTLLHDHGGSVGAFTVARGSLVEDYSDRRGDGLRTRAHAAGSAVAFGADYLHNLVNVTSEPTVTIHAYSQPLRSMGFFCWLPSGAHYLRRIPCDSPEPDTTAVETIAARLRVEQS